MADHVKCSLLPRRIRSPSNIEVQQYKRGFFPWINPRRPGTLPGPPYLSGGFPVKHFIVTVYTAGGRYRGNGIARSSFDLERAAAEKFGTDARCIVVRPAHA